MFDHAFMKSYLIREKKCFDKLLEHCYTKAPYRGQNELYSFKYFTLKYGLQCRYLKLVVMLVKGSVYVRDDY